jgi:hypothetical protein
MGAVYQHGQALDTDPGLRIVFLARKQHLLITGGAAFRTFGSCLVTHGSPLVELWLFEEGHPPEVLLSPVCSLGSGKTLSVIDDNRGASR